MRRIALVAFGGLAYSTFVLTILYMVGFVGNVVVPRSIDFGPVAPVYVALLVDVLLLGLFAIQHSVMARPRFKRWLTTRIPASAERSTYVILTNCAFGFMFWFWRPLPETIWKLDSTWASIGFIGLFWIGWLIALVSTFWIDHFDLFGIRQVRIGARGLAYEPIPLTMRGPYRFVRHPINLGFLIAIWATPQMTVGHMLFSVVMTAYILIATYFEERDLIAVHGRRYLDYRKTVPMLIPTGRKWPT